MTSTIKHEKSILKPMEEVPSQFDSLDIGVLIHDPETGDVLYANEFAGELYGYQRETLRQMEIAEFSSASFSQEEAVQRIRAAADGNAQQFEWRNKRATGELYWVEVRLSAITIADETYVVALVRDITEYKMTLRHLRILTRITRHNLRNKLNIIDGFLAELNSGVRSDDAEIRDRIKRNVEELLDLTQWIDTVKSAVRVDTPTEACDIAEIVREVGETYQCENDAIAWQFDCKEITARVDPKIKTAVTELVDNAVRHNPHDGLEISLSVTASQHGEQILIRISDTGQPIPDIEIEPIVGGYDPDPLEHGDGVGLWEVQTIVEAHGGRLSVIENSVDQKSIEIALPRAHTEG